MVVHFINLLVAASTLSSQNPKPNIVFIMADDLNADWKNDRLAYMPNLRSHFSEGGTEFVNHVAAQPVCGPSRSSMLLGRYPHNTGYRENSDIPSVKAFIEQHNNTVGNWLKKAGYYTAFFGKYVNGCENKVPSGWSYWGGLSNTYDFYNASIWQVDWESSTQDFTPRVMTDVHQADFLGNFTIEHVKRAVNQNRPFFVSITPVMPHWGTCYGPGPASVYPPYDPHYEWHLLDPTTQVEYSMPISPCPTNRNRHKFDNATNPKIPGVWNVSIKGNRPLFMKKAFESKPGALTEFQALREDLGWRNRSAALIDLDEMIGIIMTGLENLDVLESTYVFFTSDNGYHLGEHKMPFGKGEPYDTDVRLPFYVRGPGVIKGRKLPHPTNHLDITATIVDLARAVAYVPKPLDGLSFTSELSAPGAAMSLSEKWRQHSFSEFSANNNTWQLVRVVNSTHTYSYVWWCTNETEIFNMKEDEFQTENLDGRSEFAASVKHDTGLIVAALGKCSGSNCQNPKRALYPPRDGSLECYSTTSASSLFIGNFKFLLDPKSGKVSGIRGWAVDFNDGTPPGILTVIVRFKVNGKFDFNILPPVRANVNRTDLVKEYPKIPDPMHGFEIYSLDPTLLQGHTSLTMYGSTGSNSSWNAYGTHGANQAPLMLCLCNGIPCPCKYAK